jgi:hypothetical protein
MNGKNMKNILFLTILFWACFVGFGQVFAAKYVLLDGRVLEGKQALLSRVDEKADTEDYVGRTIVVLDDGLRFVYFPKAQLRQVVPDQPISLETFKLNRTHNFDGKEFTVVGAYSNNTPFDNFGRRLLEIHHSGGVNYVEQAIAELTPYYIRVLGVRLDGKPINWDMRIATNAVPREQISPILLNRIDPQNLEDRLKLVRFYYGGKLNSQAEAELESIMHDWKDSPDVQQQILPMFLNIQQQKYQQIIDEFDIRWENGQHRLAQKYFIALEQDPNLPEHLLEPLRRKIRQYDEIDKDCKEVAAALKELYEQLPEQEKHEKIPAIIAEIEKELNNSTLKRLTTFQLYAKDQQLSAANKLAIAITGWYAGAGADNNRLAVAITFPETEKLVADYLRSGHDFLLRQRILEQLKNLETSRPDLIAGILATMKPPFSELLPGDPNRPGFYQFSLPNPLIAPGIAPGGAKLHGAAEIRYAVQLPPDYNPYQRYPMIVTLRGLFPATPEAQLDWWVGSWRGDERWGHATRNGYIVIAPDWNPPEINRMDYDFSFFSHAAVPISCCGRSVWSNSKI